LEIIIVFVEIEKKKRVTKGGIELIGSGGDNEPVFEAIVESIGGEVDLEKCGYKIGSSIVFNEHDIKQFEVPNIADPITPIRKGIIPSRSVWGVYS
jgi:hypothetical protein